MWEVAEYIGESLVFIGVIGEVYAEWEEPHRARLGRLSSIMLVIGLAISLAALVGTNESFNGTIASLNLQAKQAGERAAKDEMDAAQARKEADEAREKAEAEHLARIQLEQQMAWRSLSNAQGSALCSAIPKEFVNNVRVVSSSQDAEAFRYAQDFAEALTKCLYAAGFGSRGFTGSLGVGNSFWGQDVPFGIWVRYEKHLTLDDSRSPDIITNPTKRRALANSIRKALEAHGVKVEGISDQALAGLDIYVGPKFSPRVEHPEIPASDPKVSASKQSAKP